MFLGKANIMKKNQCMSKSEYENSIKDMNNLINILTSKSKQAIRNSENYIYIASGDALIICALIKKLIKYYRKKLKALEKKHT